VNEHRLTRRGFIQAVGALGGLAGAGATPFDAPAAAPLIEKMDLFAAGVGGYALYRIPGVVATKRGTLLAYCEARAGERGDWGAIDILLRRSADGGRTWDAPRKVAAVEGPKSKNPAALAQQLADPEAVTYNNPVAIADGRSGAVHFLFCLEYARCFYLRSDDDGRTFSEPVEITATFDQFKPEYDWKVLATGPGHGIRMGSGRLVVPVWLSTGTGGHAHRPSWVSVVYSDDAGRTWRRREFAARHSEEIVNPSETAAVELNDGRVMLNIRSESKAHRRAISFSRDGATGWTRPVFDPALSEPVCFGALARIKAGDKSRILFINPDNLYSSRLKASVEGAAQAGAAADRRNLTVRLSYDEARTWPVSKVVEPGYAGYADIAFSPRHGSIYAFYERGGLGDDHFRSRALTLARFNLEWLTGGRERLKI
jgi:sialidase-1